MRFSTRNNCAVKSCTRQDDNEKMMPANIVTEADLPTRPSPFSGVMEEVSGEGWTQPLDLSLFYINF